MLLPRIQFRLAAASHQQASLAAPLGRRWLASRAKNPYAVLGVSPGVCADALKAAYREQALLYHPDRHPDPDSRGAAETSFKELNAAYARLSRSSGGMSAHVEHYAELFPSRFLEVFGVRKRHSEGTVEHLLRATSSRLWPERRSATMLAS